MNLLFGNTNVHDKPIDTFPRPGENLTWEQVRNNESFPHWMYLRDAYLLLSGIDPESDEVHREISAPIRGKKQTILFRVENAAIRVLMKHWGGRTDQTLDQNDKRTFKNLYGETWWLLNSTTGIKEISRWCMENIGSWAVKNYIMAVDKRKNDDIVKMFEFPVRQFFDYIIVNVPTAWSRYIKDTIKIAAQAEVDNLLQNNPKLDIITWQQWYEGIRRVALKMFSIWGWGPGAFENACPAIRWGQLEKIISLLNDKPLPFGYSIDTWIEQPDYVEEQAEQIQHAAIKYGERPENWSKLIVSSEGYDEEHDPYEDIKKNLLKYGVPAAIALFGYKLFLRGKK